MTNKKGIFFTVLTIAIISLFFLSYTLFSYFDQENSVQKRVESLNNFVFSIDEDLPRQMFIFGFRTIFLFEKEIVESGTYVDNIDQRVSEAFFNGTLYGEPEELLIGTTFSDLQSSLRERGMKVSADVNLSFPSVQITQDDPWNVKIVLNTTLVIEDLNKLVRWERNATIVSYIPVKHFDDPFYLVNTNGRILNKVVKTPYTDFISGSDVSKLLDHAGNSYYVASLEAPSFLDRLKGDNVPSQYGIESIVDLDDLAAQGITLKQKSVVDHIYFSGSNPPSCNILPSGMPAWFRLDDSHLATYNASACA